MCHDCHQKNEAKLSRSKIFFKDQKHFPIEGSWQQVPVRLRSPHPGSLFDFLHCNGMTRSGQSLSLSLPVRLRDR